MKINAEEVILSGCLASVTLIFATILMFAIGETVFRNAKGIGEVIPYLLNDIVITVCCYFIVKKYPSSIWYVPLICNLVGIIAAIVEPSFWITSMWIPVCGGWVLSIIASIIGAMVGKRTTISDNP
jgi:hypothetical protein